jgi:hypothetical protein
MATPACSFAVAVLFVSAPLLSLSSQSPSDTSARISGSAASTYNGTPLAGVLIAVPASRKFVVTDSLGTFSVSGLAPGHHRVRVSYDGRETEEYEFTVRTGTTKRLAVLIDIEAYDLAPVVVETRNPARWPDLAGFYARRKFYSGFARFFTREDIDRMHPPAISGLLVNAGIFSWCTDVCQPTRWSRSRLCTVPVHVDGLPVWEYSFDHIAVAEVAGVEIYRDGTVDISYGAPRMGQYAYGGPGAQPTRDGCGSVEIWTRG